MWGAEAAKRTLNSTSPGPRKTVKGGQVDGPRVCQCCGTLSLRHCSIVYLSTRVMVAFGAYLGNGELGIESRIS